MISVQVDVRLRPEDDDTTAIWSGCWPQVPAAGDTFEIRLGEHAGMYRVERAHWVLFDADTSARRPVGPYVSSAIVTATPWDPPMSPCSGCSSALCPDCTPGETR